MALYNHTVPQYIADIFERLEAADGLERENVIQDIKTLVDTGAAPQLTGLLIELILNSDHITCDKISLRKLLLKYYKTLDQQMLLHRDTVREYWQREQDKHRNLSVAERIHLDNETLFKALQQLDHDGFFKPSKAKQISKKANRGRRLAKTMIKAFSTFHLFLFLKPFATPLSLFSALSNFINLCIDVVESCKSLFHTRNRLYEEGFKAWMKGAFTEGGRLYRIIDSFSGFANSLITTTLVLAAGLVAQSFIVGALLTAFDAGFAIYSMYRASVERKEKINFLQAQLVSVEQQMQALEQEYVMKVNPQAGSFKALIYEKQEAIAAIRLSMVSAPKHELAALNDKLQQHQSQLAVYQSEMNTPLYKNLKQSQQNLHKAISNEKTSLKQSFKDNTVGMMLFAFTMFSVMMLTFYFPAGVIMLFAAAAIKIANKIYQGYKERKRVQDSAAEDLLENQRQLASQQTTFCKETFSHREQYQFDQVTQELLAEKSEMALPQSVAQPVPVNFDEEPDADLLPCRVSASARSSYGVLRGHFGFGGLEQVPEVTTDPIVPNNRSGVPVYSYTRSREAHMYSRRNTIFFDRGAQPALSRECSGPSYSPHLC